jgi:hypothetical protein
MRRRPAANAPTEADWAAGVAHWDTYPPMTSDPVAVDAWHQAYDRICAARGLDPIAVTIEATRQGRTDQPWIWS